MIVQADVKFEDTRRGSTATTLRRAAERAKAETNAAQAKRGRNGLWCMAKPTKGGEKRILSLQK